MAITKHFEKLIRSAILIGIIVCVTSCTQKTQNVIAVNDSKGPTVESFEHNRTIATPPIALRLINEAESSLDAGSPQKSLPLLAKAQRMAPNEARVYFVYGKVYSALKQPSRARSFFKRCISLTPASSSLSKSAHSYLEHL